MSLLLPEVHEPVVREDHSALLTRAKRVAAGISAAPEPDRGQLLHDAFCGEPPLFAEMVLSLLPFDALGQLGSRFRIGGDVLNAALIRELMASRQQWLCTPVTEPVGPAARQLVFPLYDPGNGRVRRGMLCRQLDEQELSHFQVRPPETLPHAPEFIGPFEPQQRLAVVPYLDQFRLHLDVFAAGMLRGVDLSHAFVAGSAMVACLSPLPSSLQRMAEQWMAHRHVLRQLPLPDVCVDLIQSMAEAPVLPQLRKGLHELYHGHSSRYRNSDLDIFLACDSMEQAQARLVSLVAQIRANIPGPSTLVRTRNAVTVVSQHPFRNVQIIIMCVRSPEEQLVFADLDCTAVAYANGKVLMHERARRAFTTRFNFVPPGDLKKAFRKKK
jgi:hypothetical protein